MSQTITREERRSALDDFAAQVRDPAAGMVPTVVAPSKYDEIHGAIVVAVHRDEGRILSQLKALAAAAGSDWYYRYPVKKRVKDRETGEWVQATDWIEGPSIKLANDLSRLYGNCEVDCRAQDFGDAWLFHARFIDLESGFSLTRPFQQRKSASKIGGDDNERRLDAAFQIGASKAIRNVVCNALQTLADFAFEEAKEALVDKIGRDLASWRQRTLSRLGERKVDVARVEAVVGRVAAEWLAPDVARVIAMMKAVSDGMASLDETFPPPLRPAAAETQQQAASALDEFAAAGVSSADPSGSQALPASTDEGGGEGLQQASAAAGPDLETLRSDSIASVLQLASRTDLEADERLARIDDITMELLARKDAEPGFVKMLVEMAVKVVRKEVTKAAAQKYLQGLRPGS